LQPHQADHGQNHSKPQLADAVNSMKFLTKNKGTKVLRFAICDLRFVGEQAGQALVTLLFFVVMGITITTAAVIILVTNIRSTTRFEQGSESYNVAESGAEAMLLQLLRTPQFVGNITVNVNSGTATVSATQGNPITIVSTGVVNNFVRKIQVQTVYTSGVLQIQSWKEIQ